MRTFLIWLFMSLGLGFLTAAFAVFSIDTTSVAICVTFWGLMLAPILITDKN